MVEQRDELEKDRVWIDMIMPIPIREMFPYGGIVVEWSGTIGWGEYSLYWGKDKKLHADTEHMDSDENREFTREILSQLVDRIIIDD